MHPGGRWTNDLTYAIHEVPQQSEPQLESLAQASERQTRYFLDECPIVEAYGKGPQSLATSNDTLYSR